MAQIHTLKKEGESIYPVTHISAVVDDNGNTVAGLISEVEGKVPTKVSELENDKGYITEIPDNLATKEEVSGAIAEAITYTLNTEV
jgi:hypothetical protein